jgi:transposase
MHKHSRIRASRQEIARSLEGTWRQELLFVLEQSLDLYQTHQKKSRYAINALMSN